MKENEIDILKLLTKTKIQKNLNILKTKYSLYKLYDLITLILLVGNVGNTILNPMLINYIETLILASLKIITFDFSITNSEIIRSILSENNKEVINIIQNKLINSEIYKDCMNEYDNYLTNLTELFKEIKLTEPIESSIAFDILLHKGNFSHNHRYNYTVYKYNNNYEINEILGSRVATGNTVCRHESSMLTDLENKLENNSYNIPVCTKQKEIEINSENLNINHQITVIEKDNNIYASDPTNRCFITNFKQYNNNNNYIYSEPISICKNFNNNSIYIIQDDKENIDFKNNNNNIDKEKINEKYKEVLAIINENIKLISEFYNERIYQLERISELNKKLIPLSNQKIKKWKIW